MAIVSTTLKSSFDLLPAGEYLCDIIEVKDIFAELKPGCPWINKTAMTQITFKDVVSGKQISTYQAREGFKKWSDLTADEIRSKKFQAVNSSTDYTENYIIDKTKMRVPSPERTAESLRILGELAGTITGIEDPLFDTDNLKGMKCVIVVRNNDNGKPEFHYAKHESTFVDVI